MNETEALFSAPLFVDGESRSLHGVSLVYYKISQK